MLAAPAAADTLPEAIALAYATNPQLSAARAGLRAVDEGVAIARSGALPSASASGSFTQLLTERFGDAGRNWSAGATVSQPVWQGGRVRANLASADARVAAERARLAALESQIVVDVVTVYADVLRADAVVRLNEGQVAVLEQQLRASTDRFEVGDVTRTDVAQSDARLAAARAQLDAARAQAVFARQAYRRLVGRMPGALAPLPPLPPLPQTEAQAQERALEGNPQLAVARLDEEAAARDVRVARAQRGPSVAAQASISYARNEGPLPAIDGVDPRIGVTASMPLFTGGLIAAQVRQAQARQSQALELLSSTERFVTEAAVASFAQLRTAESLIQSARVQISANELAAEGTRQENLVGNRNILDVLNAEQELLQSRVALVQAERDRYVAAFQLLDATGEVDRVLEALVPARYDPEANARRVRSRQASEFGYDPDPRIDRARNILPTVGPQP